MNWIAATTIMVSAVIGAFAVSAAEARHLDAFLKGESAIDAGTVTAQRMRYLARAHGC